jgi:hypothetical protein
MVRAHECEGAASRGGAAVGEHESNGVAAVGARAILA